MNEGQVEVADKSPKRMMVRVSPSCWQALLLNEVTHIQADQAEAQIFTKDGKSYRCSTSLGRLASMLEPHGFRRTHRSFLVNLEYIDRLIPRTADWEIVLTTGGEARIPVSRRRAELRPDFLWI